MCVHSRTAQQRRVLQERHQLNRTGWIHLRLCRLSEGFGPPALIDDHCLRFTEAAQPGSERSFGSGLLELLLLRVVGDAVPLQALPHGEGLPAARVRAGEGPQLLVEGADVALQVEHGGEGPVAAIPGALEDQPGVGVDVLMLLQEPGVPEHLAALLTLEEEPVLLLPVLQVLRPGLPREAAAFLLAGVTSVHLLVSLQLAGDAEAHLAAFMRALVWRQLGVLLTHVGLQLLLLLELQLAALEPADVVPVLLPGVDAVNVPCPVGVGGESLRAAVHGAEEGFVPAVAELVSGQVVAAAEGLPAVAAERLHSGVFTQMSVQFPLFVISRRAAGHRADEPLQRLCFRVHLCGAKE